jgi:hypothetical protein
LKAENKIRTRDRKEVAILVVAAACVWSMSVYCWLLSIFCDVGEWTCNFSSLLLTIC